MAVKILKIQLEADTSGLVKLSKVADDVESSLTKVVSKQERLNSLEVHKQAILNEQAASYARLQGVADRANTAIENKSRGHALGEGRVTASLERHNSLLEKQRGILRQLTIDETNLQLDKASFTTGKSATIRQAELDAKEVARLAKETADIRIAQEERVAAAVRDARTLAPASAKQGTGSLGFVGADTTQALEYKNLLDNKAIADTLATAKHKEALDKQAFDDKAYINKRTIDFAAMFDTIAAKEARLANTIRDARTLAPASASGTGAIQSLTGGAAQANIVAAKAKKADEQRIAGFQTMINRMSLLERIHTATVVGELNNQSNAAKAAYKARQADLERAFAPKSTSQSGHDKVIKDLQKMADSHRSLSSSVIASTIIYKTFTNTVNAAWNALKSIPKVGIELEATMATLMSTMGSGAGAVGAMEYLDAEAKRTGITISTLRTSWRDFSASTTLAGAKLSETTKMFSNLNTVITALHLSTDRAQGVFNAMAQIFNKGKVQSEELVKQLGNLLPGAFAVFAKSMSISTEELSSRMKKGLVKAKDTIPAFAEEFKNIFAGSFAVASQGMNANIGRMQTGFTHLGETLYNLSSGPMVEIVKGITSVTNTMSAGIEKTTRYGETLTTVKSILEGALAGGVIATVILNLSKIRLGLAALTIPGLLITGLATVASYIAYIYNKVQAPLDKFEEAKRKIEEFNSSTVFDDKTVSIAIRVENDPTVKNAIKELEDLKAAQFDFEKNNQALKAKQAKGTADPQEYAEYKRQAAEQAKILVQSQDMVAKAKLASQIQIEQYDKEAADRQKDLATQHVDTVKQTKAQIAKEYKDLYADIARDAANASEAISTQVSKLDQDYAANLVSISTYFAKKKELQLADLDQQIQANDKARDIAAKAYLGGTGPESKVDEYYDKQTKLIEQVNQVQNKSDADKKAALVDYNNMLVETLAKYKELQGDLVGAAQLRFSLKEEPAIAKYKATVADTSGNVTPVMKAEAEHALFMEASNKRNAGLQETINAQNTKRNEINTAYSQKLQEINILTDAGTYSQLGSLLKIQELNKERIAQLEEIVQGEEKAVAAAMLGANGISVSAQIRKQVEGARGELRGLKAEANVVGRYFETALGNAFESSFAGLIQGTVTAKQAFASFSASVQSEIAKIIASEIRSAVLGKLFSLAGTALMGAFGSSTSVANGNSASFTSTMNSPNFWGTKAANGHAVSGISSVSGSVLSTPTYFPSAKVIPFASGGVLAGEAGKEAVLPLKRGKGGKLGVAMEGGASSSGITIQNINISMQAKEDSTSQEQAAMIGKAIKDNLKVLMKQELASSARSGGQLNPTQMVANF